ncbi:hypothetical protein [Mycobacterium paraense]|uniref:hypothetical protein n=1 Tax=Mycobacterium paraense TaxID=767916 RepID=UPI001153FBEA|nr:hypothetical protein [Mycobacterium paraense]
MKSTPSNDDVSPYRAFYERTTRFASIIDQPFTPASTTHLTVTSGSPDMHAKTSWISFAPYICYLLAAGSAIVTVWTRVTSIALVIPLLVLIGLLLQSSRDARRRRELGTSLIEEAQTVKQLYPNEYPAYLEEARYTLVRLGLDDLVAGLPAN